MDTATYELEKHDFEADKATFLENEKAILTHIEQLHTLLEIRQPLAHKLIGQYNSVRHAANELKTGDAIRFDILVIGETFGEVLKAWMDRYFDRKRGGYDLSYERLLSNRPEPRQKPGKQYDSCGHEIQVRSPRKLKAAPENMTDTMKKIAKW